MTSDNGRLPASALTIVQPGMRLSIKTAIAWLRLVAAAWTTLGRRISIAGPAGAYRSYAVQAAMRAASLGRDVDEKRKWGLSTVSTAALAAAGYSEHGLGICVDVLGTPMDEAFLALAKRYGFSRPLPGDPNHFRHDGRTQCTEPVKPAAKPAAAKPAPAKPAAKKQVTVKAGDTLAKIAAAKKTTWQKLAAKNGLKAPYRIFPGQKLDLP